MSRINTNVSSLIAQRALANNQTQLNTSLERLSTGLQINSGADDPAGLIASKSLDAEKTGIQTAINNASLANNVIGTAEGGLNEVSNLLTQLTGLVNQSANTGGLQRGRNFRQSASGRLDPEHDQPDRRFHNIPGNAVA